MDNLNIQKIYKKIMRNSIAFWIYFIFLIFTAIYTLSLMFYTDQIINWFKLPEDYIFKFIWETDFKDSNETLNYYFNGGLLASALIGLIAYLYGVIDAFVINSKLKNIEGISKSKKGFFVFNSIFNITGIWIIFYLISWIALYKAFKKANS